jgi:hypothetical protein
MTFKELKITCKLHQLSEIIQHKINLPDYTA